MGGRASESRIRAVVPPRVDTASGHHHCDRTRAAASNDAPSHVRSALLTRRWVSSHARRDRIPADSRGRASPLTPPLLHKGRKVSWSDSNSIADTNVFEVTALAEAVDDRGAHAEQLCDLADRKQGRIL